MYRTFITSIPLQGRSGLQKGRYEPKNLSLRENVETSFPIIPIIKEKMEKADNVRIITVRTENSDTETNYGLFVKELNELGISESQIKNIILKEDQLEVESKALLSIVDAIEEDSIVYADITFGTKPMSAAVLYSMSVVDYLKNDVEAGGTYYGEVKRVDGKVVGQYLYDCSGYKRYLDILRLLSGNVKVSVENKRDILNSLFN